MNNKNFIVIAIIASILLSGCIEMNSSYEYKIVKVTETPDGYSVRYVYEGFPKIVSITGEHDIYLNNSIVVEKFNNVQVSWGDNPHLKYSYSNKYPNNGYYELYVPVKTMHEDT